MGNERATAKRVAARPLLEAIWHQSEFSVTRASFKSGKCW